MTVWTASLQPLLIAAVLVWAGAVKLRGLTPEQARRNALSRIVGEPRTPTVWRLVGATELVVAVALLTPPAHPAKAAAAALLTAGFLGFLGYARLAAPDAGCGCMSARLAPVTWRSFARAGMLLAAALFAAVAGQHWWAEPIAASPFAAVLVLLVEAAVFVALSSEFDRHWLRPLRQLKVRLTHPLAFDTAEVPLEFTVEQLQLSEPYRRIGASLASDVQDRWEEGDWRILTYRVRGEAGTGTAVFAVPLHRYDPEAVRMVLVDESSGEPVVSGV